MRISLKETRLGLRNSTTRLPFRYGTACLTTCPQAVLEAQVEINGSVAVGYSGDCLPPGWFDKTPTRDYQQQIDDMLSVIHFAEHVMADQLRKPNDFFRAYLALDDRVHDEAVERNWPDLLAGFGTSLVERAVIDAVGRATNSSLNQLVRKNVLGISAGEIHPELSGTEPAAWLPQEPRRQLYVRHTIGLADPLSSNDIPAGERLNDGFPQSVDQYIDQKGIQYFKIKLANQLDHDVARLEQFVSVVEPRLGKRYRLTLDGNEQYKQADDFSELIEQLRCNAKLVTLLANTLVIEQPLERSIALDSQHTASIRKLGETIPVIIDESDGTRDSYRQAIDCGYRGVSSKSCKGVLRSLLNAGLTWHLNQTTGSSPFVMTGEDLCSVGVIPVQSDLCLVATLGLEHIERNGHHYHPGISYLPPEEQEAALKAHPDFLGRRQGVIGPNVVGGLFEIASLQCPGTGFAALPDMETMQTAEDWSFASLGLTL